MSDKNLSKGKIVTPNEGTYWNEIIPLEVDDIFVWFSLCGVQNTEYVFDRLCGVQNTTKATVEPSSYRLV